MSNKIEYGANRPKKQSKKWRKRPKMRKWMDGIKTTFSFSILYFHSQFFIFFFKCDNDKGEKTFVWQKNGGFKVLFFHFQAVDFCPECLSKVFFPI